MKEIFRLSKKEKKTVKEVLQNELQRYYSEDEAEILMNKVLDGRDKVQEALETYEKAYTEYISLEEKIGVVLRKRNFTPIVLKKLVLPDFVCLVGNGAETYLDLHNRLYGCKPEKNEEFEKFLNESDALNNSYEEYIKRTYKD